MEGSPAYPAAGFAVRTEQIAIAVCAAATAVRNHLCVDTIHMQKRRAGAHRDWNMLPTCHALAVALKVFPA